MLTARAICREGNRRPQHNPHDWFGDAPLVRVGREALTRA